MYPPLAKDHKVLGHEYCSGFTDTYGKWNTGFYCPPKSADSATVFCCGTPDHKYCCSGDSPTSQPKPIVEMETEMEITNDYDPTSLPDIERNSYVAAVICGLVAVTVLMTLASCFYCSCCLLYKKRRAQLPGGLYRIPASSTTCGLINSGNGSTTPNSLVTSPMNPVFTSDSWGFNNYNNHPLQGLLPRTNPLPSQPPSGQRANVNPILNGDINNIQTTLRYYQPTALSNTNSNLNRLRRQISLLQQQNPNVSLRSTNNNQNDHNIPIIYNTGGGRFSTNGTMSSIISSVSSSNSTSSLPPPYFLEQLRIRNRVRQPRNPTPAILLPSYNETQRQGNGSNSTANDSIRNASTCSVPLHPNQSQPSQSQSQTPSPSIPITMMNDLSAPPRRRNSQTEIRNGQIIQVSNLPISPMTEECQPPRDKILNTSIQQRTSSSDTRRLQEALQEIRRKPSTASRNRIRSHSTENVIPPPIKSDSVSLNVEATLRSNQAHAT